MKAIIAGGGIGGLCAALCFHNFGWDVEVLEQAPKLSEVGAGIQISPNAVKVLRAIGVADAVEEQAFVPQSGEFRSGRSGKLIGSFKMGKHMQDRYGAPYWHIHRADLIAALEAALRERLPGAIRTGVCVASYEQDAASASAVLETGKRVTGDILVGADGIKSNLHISMLGQSRPRFTGNIAWRAVVPVSKLGKHVPPPTACVWFGEGKHAVTYRLRKGTLANLVGVVERDDWAVESWTEKGTKQDAMRDFAGWHPTIRTIIDEADAHFRWALFDRDPLRQWCDGRVALLGDACHPMLPFMAQGAAMAIEDGYVLARSLSQRLPVADSLANYVKRRQGRTAKVQLAARKNMGLFHQSTLAGKLTTYAPLWLASTIVPGSLDALNAWVYAHDVTV